MPAVTDDILFRDRFPDGRANHADARPDGAARNEFSEPSLRDAGDDETADTPRAPNRTFADRPFRFIDLFAGIGGFRAGLTALGGRCVFTSEWDKFSVRTYRAWYADDDVYTGDIRELDSGEIPDHDLLCAGFPCQPFSLAGVSKKNSLGHRHGFDDEKQGNLFFKIMDIVDHKRPPVLFLENVKNLKSHDKGRTWRVIQKSLDKRGYSAFSRVIDASAWVPQRRERIFIVCFDRAVFGSDDRIAFRFPQSNDGPNPTLSTVLERQRPDPKYMLSDKLWKYLQDYAEKHRRKGNGFGYSVFGGADVARTLSARYYKDGSEVLIAQKGFRNPRRLTPAEARQLMGFSERFAAMYGHEDGFPIVVSDTQAYRQFGNAVVPEVVEAIGREILRTLSLAVPDGAALKGGGEQSARYGRSR